jgi:hypothetical protein
MQPDGPAGREAPVRSQRTDGAEPYAASFRQFVEHQRHGFQDIELDRERMAQAYEKKRRWQFWIRPYPPRGTA